MINNNNNNNNFSIKFTKNIALATGLAVTFQGCTQYGSIYQGDYTPSRKNHCSVQIERRLREGFHLGDQAQTVPHAADLPLVQGANQAIRRQLLQRQNAIDLSETPEERDARRALIDFLENTWNTSGTFDGIFVGLTR